MEKEQAWYVYILVFGKGRKLYTGITPDICVMQTERYPGGLL